MSGKVKREPTRKSKITEQYVLKQAENVHFRPDRNSDFSYNDGDEPEERILEIVTRSGDVSIGSQELRDQISDWPSRYHLSGQRADLLRPVAHLLKGDILEFGSGCGAITRYLCELGGNVTAVEGSARRAIITAARCRDLKNVEVFCDNIESFSTPKKFDAVTLIGVLEYARMFIPGEDPVAALLEHVMTFLKPGGRLLIAIENQLGLKYFSGAPEDHLGRPFAGIENSYTSSGPVTFGKKKIASLLTNAGFGSIAFQYAFPDYKFPTAIITEFGNTTGHLHVSDVLCLRTDYIQNVSYPHSFNPELALPVIAENGLLGDLANSFLIVAGSHRETVTESEVLAYTFSTNRSKAFCKLNKFIVQDNMCLVLRERIFPQSENKSKWVFQQLEDEPYIRGELYIDGLFRLIRKPGWTLEDLLVWARPYIDLLKNLTTSEDSANHSAHQNKIDLAPFNIIVDPTGKIFSVFDLEWRFLRPGTDTLGYIAFRGLYHSLRRISEAEPPATDVPLSILELIEILFEKLLPELNLDTTVYMKLESEFMSEVWGSATLISAAENIELTPKYSGTIIQQGGLEYFKKLNVQLFWPGAEKVYSQENSILLDLELQEKPTLFRLPLPAIAYEAESFRIDIGNKPGFVNLHGIRLRTMTDELLWEWSAESLTANVHYGFFLLEHEHMAGGATLYASLTDDPQLYFTLLPENRRFLAGGSYLEIELSSPTQAQKDLVAQSWYRSGSKIEEMSAEVATVSKQLKLTEKKTQDTERILDIREETIRMLQQQVIQQEASGTFYAESIAVLNRSLTQHKEELTNKNAELADTREEQLKLRTSFSEISRQLELFRSSIDQLHSEKEHLKGEWRISENKLEESIRAIHALEKQTLFESQVTLGLQTELGAMKQLLMEKKLENEELNSRGDQLILLLHQLEREVASSSTEKSSLNHELRLKTEEAGAFENLILNKELLLDQQQKAHDAVLKQLAELEMKILAQGEELKQHEVMTLTRSQEASEREMKLNRDLDHSKTLLQNQERLNLQLISEKETADVKIQGLTEGWKEEKATSLRNEETGRLKYELLVSMQTALILKNEELHQELLTVSKQNQGLIENKNDLIIKTDWFRKNYQQKSLLKIIFNRWFNRDNPE